MALATLLAEPARRWLRRLFCALVVVAQLYFIVRGYSDPHKRFAYQMFNEADTISSQVVRVTRDGRQVSVVEPWAGYEWGAMVRARGLGAIGPVLHASSGIPSLLGFMQGALDWVAQHTPRDHETLYYRADVTYTHNGRGPYHITLRSAERR